VKIISELSCSKFLNSLKVLFNSYNTAWMSRKNEKQSQLIFPNELLEIDKILEDNSGIRI
jgi:hypothetical protein